MRASGSAVAPHAGAGAAFKAAKGSDEQRPKGRAYSATPPAEQQPRWCSPAGSGKDGRPTFTGKGPQQVVDDAEEGQHQRDEPDEEACLGGAGGEGQRASVTRGGPPCACMWFPLERACAPASRL